MLFCFAKSEELRVKGEELWYAFLSKSFYLYEQETTMKKTSYLTKALQSNANNNSYPLSLISYLSPSKAL